MNVSFTSKTVELTEKMKEFFLAKLERLQKFSRLGVMNMQVNIDRIKRRGRGNSQTQVEIVARVKGQGFAFRETGENLYQAFYRVYEKVEKKFHRTLGKKIDGGQNKRHDLE